MSHRHMTHTLTQCHNQILYSIMTQLSYIQ